jgi:hypothetical protein
VDNLNNIIFQNTIHAECETSDLHLYSDCILYIIFTYSVYLSNIYIDRMDCKTTTTVMEFL